jgi:hypothetical protein
LCFEALLDLPLGPAARAQSLLLRRGRTRHADHRIERALRVGFEK